MRRFKIPLMMALPVGLVSIAYDRETILPDQAAKLIGRQKTEYGKVASAHFAAKSKGQPTSLNLDKPHPARVFTLIVRGTDPGKFEKPPEKRAAPGK